MGDELSDFIRGDPGIENCKKCLTLKEHSGFLATPGTPWLGHPPKMFIPGIVSGSGSGSGTGFKLNCFVFDPNFSRTLMDFLKDGESLDKRCILNFFSQN
jgi:hypothetical protein